MQYAVPFEAPPEASEGFDIAVVAYPVLFNFTGMSWLVEQSWTYCVLVEPHGLIDPHGYFLEVLLWSSLISQINLGIFPSASKPMPKFELRC